MSLDLSQEFSRLLAYLSSRGLRTRAKNATVYVFLSAMARLIVRTGGIKRCKKCDFLWLIHHSFLPAKHRAIPRNSDSAEYLTRCEVIERQGSRCLEGMN